MTRLNKGLLSAFIILLLFTVGEIIYYFLFLTPKTPSPQASNTFSSSNSSNGARVSSVPAVNNTGAISHDTIESLEEYKQDILNSAVVDVVLKGKVAKISKGGTKKMRSTTNNTILYPYTIELGIQGASNGTNGLYFSAKDFSKVTVVKQVDGKEETASFSDLQIGDIIMVYEKIDLTKNVLQGDSLIDCKIVKM